MGAPALDFARLTTPALNGEVLVEPSPSGIRAVLEANAGLAGRWNVPLADGGMQAARREVRRQVASVDDARPLIVTGHQPEFIHPGVWAKHVVAARLAEAVGGTAVNLVVDSDTPKRKHLPIPTVRDGRLTLAQVPYAELAPGATYECIPRMDPAAVARFERALRDLLGERFGSSMLGVYCRALASDADDFVDQAVAGCGAVEGSFNVGLQERRVSRCWPCPWLLADMLANAGRFFHCYNAALGDYRRMQGIAGRQHPIPDLGRDGPRFELPIWAGRRGERRRRLFVEPRPDRLHLFADQDELGTVGLGQLQRMETARQALANLEGVLLRPRALTLTLWARTMLADLFLHGIGGAKYDRITDLLIRRYYGVTPPRMACVSATLLLDLPRRDASPADERELVGRLRDLRYNPQRHLAAGPEVDPLLAARAGAVRRSDELRATNRRLGAERRAVFSEIRSLNERLLRSQPRVMADLDAQLLRTRERVLENQVAGRRDYFFAMYDRAALEGLCATLPAVEDFRV